MSVAFDQAVAILQGVKFDPVAVDDGFTGDEVEVITKGGTLPKDGATILLNAIIEATLERLHEHRWQLNPPPKKHEAFADVRLDAVALAALCAARSHDDAFANRIAVREVARCIKRVLDEWEKP